MNNPVFVGRQDIDPVKWDRTIKGSVNGRVYARTTLLDQMSPDWAALILNDYETVLPLTWRKKYGVRYLYQPPFLQQLGVFGRHSESLTAMFIEEAKKHFSFAEILLNHNSHIPGSVARQNFIIDLKRPYEEIHNAYADVHHKNLKRSANAGLTYANSIEYTKIVDLNYQLYGGKSGVDKSAYDQLSQLATQHPDLVMVREVWQKQDLQAAAFCLIDEQRIYFVMSAVTPEGKKNQANHFLVDQLIREFSGKSMVLDFEGSDVEGIANFYKGFGAVNEPYYFCKWNQLPWPYKLFKK